MTELGSFKISSLVVDRLKLDGGAMFGSVPKNLWSKRIEPDEQNRIPLGCRLLKIVSPKATYLVDAGCGRKWDDKLRSIYAIENLQALPEGIDRVILTHLHFDHGGGISVFSNDQSLLPAYPDASVYVNKVQYDHSRRADIRDRASFMAENIDPLEQMDLKLVEHGLELEPGLSLHQVDGHTPGLQWIKLTAGEKTIAYPSDLIPTAHHLDLPYIMGYDLSAEKTLVEKRNFLEQAAEGDWTIVFEHDLETEAVRIFIEKSGKIKIKEKLEI